nr:PREDICTED: palmitoyltransferase ZDHHC3-like [Lepisosteus oculatus]
MSPPTTTLTVLCRTLTTDLHLSSGVVPLPETAIDFSDLRSQTTRKTDRVSEGAAGIRIPSFPSSFHDSINNCVGELNQKYFIQFLFYTGLASLYSIALVVSAWVWRIRSEREGEGAREEDGGPSKHLIVAHYIILLVESVLFGVFVTVIFYDQLVSIITDETPIEQIRNRLMKDKAAGPHQKRKPKLLLLREVFGRGSVLCWLFPLRSGPPSSGGISYSALPDYDV